MAMRKKSIFLLLFILAFSLGFSCNNQGNNGNFEEEKEFNRERNRGESPDFEKLDRKMHEIMNEKYGDEDGPDKEIRVIEAKEAKNVEVDLKIGAGKLRLSGGASELLLAGFIFSDKSWNPDIVYTEKGELGRLSIRQPETKDFSFNDDDKYVWNLKFNNEMPLSFNIELGAGVSEIFLDGLTIDDFSMVTGVGKSEIDLRGNWKKSTTINITGGIGLSHIYLPKNTGVKLYVDKGIGSLDFSGLIRKGKNQYVNSLYENSDIILTVNLTTGIGKIEIE
jgi:hypothetical protein